MKKLLITYHSQTGNTQKLVDYSYQCALALQLNIVIDCRHISTVNGEDFLNYDGFIFACPENFGALSGLMKDLFDRSYLAVHERTGGKAYSLLISCDNDGHGAVAQASKILTGYSMVEAFDSVIVRGGSEVSAEDFDKVKAQVEYMALALETGVI